MNRRRILAALSLLAGAVALVAIVLHLDLRAAASVVRLSGAGGAAAFVGWCALIFLLQTVGWHVLLRARGWRVPFPRTIESMLMGHALDWITPSAYLGGEPVRIWHMSARQGHPSDEVAATVVVHKFAEFAGFIVAMLACLGTMLWSFDLSTGVRIASTSVCAVLLAIFLGLFAAFVGRWPVASGLLRVFGRRAQRLRAWAERAEHRIEETFRAHRGAFFVALVFTGGPAALIVLKPFVFFWFLGRSLPFPELALLFVLTQIVLALHFTPGGIGLFEGGVLGAFALAGIGAPEAAAYAVMQRLADTVLVGPGVAFAAREGAGAFFRGRPAPEK